MKKLKYFKILLRYLKNEKLLIALYIILSVIMYASPVLGTLVWADMYEALSEVNLHNFLILIVINGALNILCWSILDYPINRIFNRLQANFMSEINRDLYKKINDLPSIAFEEIGTGEFVNRMYTDPNNILDLLSLLIKLSTRLVTAIVFVFITFTISVSAGLELIGLCGSMFIFANIYYPKIKKNHEEIKKVSDKYVKDITENISGVREIKALGIKKTINNNVNNTIINLFNKEKKQSNDESM
jgi:ATP-binding cassette subfamily B protein